MIETGCMNYDGDIDCAKCTVHGYIYGCEGCDDFVDFFGHTKTKEEQKNDGFRKECSN